MKIRLTEHEGCFNFDAEAESVADAALLARFALNANKKVRTLNASAHKDGSFLGYVVFGKRRNVRIEVKS